MSHLIAYDGTNIVHRAYFAQTGMGVTAEPARTVALALGMVTRWTARIDAGARVVIALDGGDSGRRSRYPAYKANRQEKPEALVASLQLFFRVAQDHHAVRRIVGYEADDVLATLVRQQRASGGRTSVVSSDHDILQLAETVRDFEGQDIHVVLPYIIKSAQVIEEATASYVVAARGFPAPRLPLYYALAGEPGDNWPGLQGVGPVHARQLAAVYATADELLADHDPARIFPRKQLRESVQRRADLLRLGVWLMTLQQDVPGVTLP